MSDLIDRQAAIEAMRKCQTYRFSETEPRMIMLAAAEEVIEELPSAQPEHATCYLDSPCEYQNSNIELPPEQPEQRWIPVSERLPEIGQSVLLSVGGMYSAEGCLREDGDWAQFRWDAIQRKDMVGAWKPLPEPYKGEQE